MNWRLLLRVGITVAIVLLLDGWFARAQTPGLDIQVSSGASIPASAETQVDPLDGTSAKIIAIALCIPQRNSQ